MNTLVLTYCDDRYAELGAITNQSKKKYASARGYDYSLRSNRPRGETPPFWHKLVLVHQMLEYYERVIWMDADIIVTNPMVSLMQFSPANIHFSRDWGTDATTDEHFSCGAYVAHKCNMPVIEEALRRTEHIRSPFGDQDALRSVYRDAPLLRGMFAIHPRRTFNAVHPEIDPTVVEPWTPLDFLCHLTMVPMEKRIELAKKVTSI